MTQQAEINETKKQEEKKKYSPIVFVNSPVAEVYMDNIMKKSLNEKLKIPFVVALIGILVLIVGMFLPYMTAVGKLAAYIEKYPDSVEIEEFDMTASDLKDIPMMYMGRIAASAYNEEEGILFHVIVIVFAFLSVLTALFVLLKKPIGVMIFGLITCGSFTVLNLATKADFFGADKYAWGIGYHVIRVALGVVFVTAIWMLIKKIIAKREYKAIPVAEPVIPAAEAPAE